MLEFLLLTLNMQMPAWYVWYVKLKISWLYNIQFIWNYISAETCIIQKLVICNALQISRMVLIDIRSLTRQGLDFFDINRLGEEGGGGGGGGGIMGLPSVK